VHLGPVKKSLSIERRAGKVKEQFTPKVLFHGIVKTHEEQLRIMDEVIQLRIREVENSKILKHQGVSLAQIRKGVDSSTAAAGDSDIYLRDLQEQLTTATEDIQKSVDAAVAKLSATIAAIPRPTPSPGPGGEQKK
jgi:hypothetical protein